MTLRVFSFGGGVQSTAALVLAASRRLDVGTFLFANVGSDSENPDTLTYVEEVAKPYATRYGLVIQELHHTRRDGSIETLYQHITRPELRSIDIPVRMANGAPGRRNCTATYKILLVARWLKQHGATSSQPADTLLGISIDEALRMKHSLIPHVRNVYPLVDMHLTRNDCVDIITDAGLPVPPKSSCWFCPFKKLDDWRDMRIEKPQLFEKAGELEQILIGRRTSLGKDPVFLTSRGVPLHQAIGSRSSHEVDDLCDSGYCML